MTSLYETAINGLGLGTKASDLDQMTKDADAAGHKVEAEMLLQIGVALVELQSAERRAASSAEGLARALARFQDNQSVSKAEWITARATEIERSTRDAQSIYSRIGAMWRLYQMTQV